MNEKKKFSVEFNYAGSAIKQSFSMDSLGDLEQEIKNYGFDIDRISNITIENNYVKVVKIKTKSAPKKKESTIQQWRKIIDPED